MRPSPSNTTRLIRPERHHWIIFLFCDQPIKLSYGAVGEATARFAEPGIHFAASPRAASGGPSPTRAAITAWPK